MARDFNGGTDKATITLATGQKGLSAFTVHMALKRDSAGGVGYGSVFTWENGSATRICIFQNDNGDSGWGMYFDIGFTTGTGAWTFDYPGDTNWHYYTLLYDGTSTANDLIAYKDGVSLTIIERSAPSGTLLASEVTCILGNRSNQTEGWDGGIAEYGLWNRLLTAGEIASLGKGLCPMFITKGLVQYNPLIGRTSPEIELIKGSNATLTGTATIAHPKITYISSPKINSLSVAVISSIKKISGITIANVKKLSGITKANIKKLIGITN